MRINEKTNKLVLTAMMACLILVATMMFKVPIPGTQGYVHLGDAMIFLAVMVLGVKYGTIAAMMGSVMGDILGGFVAWAPWTLGIKGLMAIVFGLFLMQSAKHSAIGGFGKSLMNILGMTFAGLVMTIGYYAAEVVMYGNPAIALLGVPWNLAQFVVGMVLSTLLAESLCRTAARRYFAKW